MKCVVHIEIVLSCNSIVSPTDVQHHIQEELLTSGFISPGTTLPGSAFNSDAIKKNVTNVNFGEVSELLYNYQWAPENVKKLSLEKVKPEYHVYRLEEEEIQSEELDVVGDGESEPISAANYCLLPHRTLNDVWENLVFDDNIKEKLLDYASTSIIFSQNNVNTNIICWNRVILLYGPPGTGKTSLCKGLAQKLSIRLKKYYAISEFIEINSHSLFSKYYSESGKLVMKMFAKIREHLDYGKSLVCVLIDEIESLTHARNSCMNGAEPADSIRVVNAILTQLDQIRKYPNVLILTTSNLKSAIDIAFVDRADLQIYVGPPTWRAIYQILVSCLKELIRVGIIKCEHSFEFASADCISDVKKDFSYKLSDVAKSCEGFSGRILRKLPFLAYSSFSKKEIHSINNYIDSLQQAVDQCKISCKDIYNVHEN